MAYPQGSTGCPLVLHSFVHSPGPADAAGDGTELSVPGVALGDDDRPRGDPRCTARSAAAPTPGSSTRRVADDGGAIRRRRSCPSCEKRFTTVEQMQLMVLKRSGATEPFTREKAISGVRKACKGRPVSEDDLARLGQAVEDALRGDGWAEVPANEVGLAILGPLRELDEVAYLRFASVYRAFESAEDFETEIAMLRAERQLEPARSRPQPDLSRRADHRSPGA